MSHRLKSRSLAAILMTAMAVPYNPAAWAANHPLTGLADTNTLDYVVNVDWDFDKPPTHIANPSQVLDRTYITSVLRQMAQSKFTMTEGRHRVGTVYVYKNAQFGNNVDIRMLNTSDRSAANVSGWGKRNFTSFNHVAMNGQPESIQGLGQVITHELGHYTYGLFDEYREEGKALDGAIPFASDTRSIKFLFLPPEHDPDSFIRERGKPAFDREIATATPISTSCAPMAATCASSPSPPTTSRTSTPSAPRTSSPRASCRPRTSRPA